MRNASILISAMFLAVGCGSDGVGFYANGTIQIALVDSAGMTGQTGFNLSQRTKIDFALPPGATHGYIGSCSVGPTMRAVHITGIGWEPQGLREVTITMPGWDQDQCTNCEHGQIQALIGDQAYTGTEDRGSGASKCTFSASPTDLHGMQFAIQCNGLATADNSRTAAITVALGLDDCDGKNTPK